MRKQAESVTILPKKEVVYTSLMMCENAPPEWLHVPEEKYKKVSTVYPL